jgi:hypothetical protein
MYTRERKQLRRACMVFLARRRVRFSLAYHSGYAAFNLPSGAMDGEAPMCHPWQSIGASRQKSS